MKAETGLGPSHVVSRPYTSVLNFEDTLRSGSGITGPVCCTFSDCQSVCCLWERGWGQGRGPAQGSVEGVSQD